MNKTLQILLVCAFIAQCAFTAGRNLATEGETMDQQISSLRAQIADKIKSQQTIMADRITAIAAISTKTNELKVIEA